MMVKAQSVYEDTDSVVKDYLESQCRPFGTNDIVQNLSSKVGKKSAIQKSLESLAQQKKIVAKNFNKIVIYCCQDQIFDNKIDMANYTFDKMTDLKKELNELDKKYVPIMNQYQALIKELPNNELIAHNLEKEKQIDTIREKILVYKTSETLVTEDLVAQYKLLQSNMDKDLMKRAKMMKSLVLLLKDIAQTKNFDEFLEELGYEVV